MLDVGDALVMDLVLLLGIDHRVLGVLRELLLRIRVAD